MRKSISSMYFSTTAALLIVSTAVLCAIQMYLVMGYFKQDKKESLSEVVSIVTSQIHLRQQSEGTVDVDPALLDSAGKLHLEKAGLLAYAHGDYYALGKQLGKFGWSVRKKKPAPKKTGARPQAPSSPRRPRK